MRAPWCEMSKLSKCWNMGCYLYLDDFNCNVRPAPNGMLLCDSIIETSPLRCVQCGEVVALWGTTRFHCRNCCRPDMERQARWQPGH